jgi:LacI family transcriptional regulator
MSITIKDVARLAQCSIKTVSRVMNNEPNVSDSIRQRVLTAVRNTGYVPNQSARRLVQQRSFALCIIMYPGFYNSSSAFLSRLLDLGYEENYEILIQNYYPNRPKSRQRIVELVNERRFDGFVSTPPCDSDEFLIDFLSTYKIPLVQVNPLAPMPETIYVSGEDDEGAYQVTKHLIRLGHRRIAFFAGPRNLRSSQDRFSGFKRAMSEHNLNINADFIQDTEYTFAGGATALKILLRQSTPPSAIFAGHDEAAIGALYAARELGLDVPSQLSIAGFENLPISTQIWPRMTTFHQPADDLLVEAARVLITLLKSAQVRPVQQIMEGHLVIRNSTTKINQ